MSLLRDDPSIAQERVTHECATRHQEGRYEVWVHVDNRMHLGQGVALCRHNDMYSKWRIPGNKHRRCLAGKKQSELRRRKYEFGQLEGVRIQGSARKRITIPYEPTPSGTTAAIIVGLGGERATGLPREARGRKVQHEYQDAKTRSTRVGSTTKPSETLSSMASRRYTSGR